MHVLALITNCWPWDRTHFFSLSRLFLFSLLLMFLTGFGMMVQTASGKTVLRTIAEEDKRGRVMSFCAMALPLLRKKYVHHI